ncbi:hypothetical protein NQ317_006927 [Molorchus minor]|uniref:SWIM-type domain-containing protein n=1 Tax=Molorchus minor TaxID=1323400 RepID=A0ABQ9IPZ3_9CUCU|nr:hypothetical protein NQ317_006927 [Molorchus minor]
MSDYLAKLKSENPDVAARYCQKLSIINDVDPYSLKESDLVITRYLVLTTSFYTGQQMKAFKSLHAYKYLEAGFVSSCGVININNCIVVRGKVKHSQRMHDPPLQVWIICNSDGSIENGHCTCMAGAGEVCSHVGAVLYALQFIHLSKNQYFLY